MTYEYYKENFKKLTKSEINSNKDFRTRYYEEKEYEHLQSVKSQMKERLEIFLRKEND